MKKTLPDWLIGRLSEYEKIVSIPQAFNDSTHQLWRLEKSCLDQSNHFLKVCSNTSSPFWQIMQDLFSFDLCTKIATFPDTYTLIDETCSLEIPTLIKAETVEANKAYILTTELNGSVVDKNIKDEMVRQLAHHLVELHSNPIDSWGSLNNPEFMPSDWSNRLKATLIESAQSRHSRENVGAQRRRPEGQVKTSKKWGGVNLDSDKYLKQALAACALIETTDFVPSMPDLRWDQFLQQDDVVTALVDLDAFVFAPRELDFIILEFILSPAQISIFNEVYKKYHTIPEVKQVRPAYRLLLFYMQILGETDLDKWMNKEALF